MIFDSEDGVTRAVAAPESADVFSDVPNFTNYKLLLMLGQTAGSWERYEDGIELLLFNHSLG